ncbi:unnamed protein product [Durusdinium trenchii]|uniref:SGNH hydrolase-type esterase domain-containing protein n=1 Tax=Durusdinium trenchii TaxID=1381693 RepID=A0ABP0IVS0_9DINO
MANLAPKLLVFFGDSHVEGGDLGYGLVGSLGTFDPDYPSEAMVEPLQRLLKDYGSAYPFKELGWYQGCFSDGLSWPHLLGEWLGLEVMNFSHSGATTCQSIAVPPGYVGISSSMGLDGYIFWPRGVAQQIRQASRVLATEQWQDPDTLVIVGSVGNDVVYSGAAAIGSTLEEAAASPYISNCKQIVSDLVALGVNRERIILTGLQGLECLPGIQSMDFDLEWLCHQQDAINEVIDALVPLPRWTQEKVFRSMSRKHSARVKRCLYELMPFTPEELPEKARLAQLSAADGAAIWFDEYHPSSMLHHELANAFAEQFLRPRRVDELARAIASASEEGDRGEKL